MAGTRLGGLENAQRGETVDVVMVAVGAVAIALMWAFAKGLEKL